MTQGKLTANSKVMALLILGGGVLTLALLFVMPFTPLQADSTADSTFDGMTYQVWHVTDDSTGCLDVSGGKGSDGQSVQTWDCNDTDAQKWRFEQRNEGDYEDSYRLVSLAGDDTYCLDNRGDFETSNRMGVWSCVGHGHGAAANQSVTIAESGEGYTITFARDSDSKSVWLTTGRKSSEPQGGAGQTTVTDTVPAAAVWHIGEEAPSDESDSALDIDGQEMYLQHVNGDSTACLAFGRGAARNGQELRTMECNRSDGQLWRFEKRTEGEYEGAYCLVSMEGDDNFCLDNRGDFTTSRRMSIWNCVEDSHRAAANQSVTIAESGDGYTLTFTVTVANKSQSAWLTTSRASKKTGGSVGQTTVTETVPASAIWSITDSVAPPPQPAPSEE